MISVQVVSWLSQSKVPLSWVPPCTSWSGRFGFTDTLWNWSVERPLFIVS